MFPINEETIKSMQESNLDTLIELDKNGLFVNNSDNIDTFRQRLNEVYSQLNTFNTDINDHSLSPDLKNFELDKSIRIPESIIEEASELTEKTYFFKINWIPGFFTGKLPPFAGGCTVSYHDNLSFFLLRNSFYANRKWLFYTRSELISHELCHTARGTLDDQPLEEYFAYKISFSPLRRYLGSCFQSSWAPFLFLIPFFILLASQFLKLFFFHNLDMIFFWILIFIYPFYLLLKNHYYRSILKKASKSMNDVLQDNAQYTDAVLFRCTTHEIKQIAGFRKNKHELIKWLKIQKNKSLKWKIINKRFIDL